MGQLKHRDAWTFNHRGLYTTKEEASSPTVSLKAIMLSCTIDAKESRYVVVTDIPGPFIHADMQGKLHMILEGEITKLII